VIECYVATSNLSAVRSTLDICSGFVPGIAGLYTDKFLDIDLLCLLSVTYLESSATFWLFVRMKPTECVCA
jgi:hypothetical protein